MNEEDLINLVKAETENEIEELQSFIERHPRACNKSKRIKLVKLNRVLDLIAILRSKLCQR